MTENRPLAIVKRRRKALKLSQAALAHELGVHALTVSRWETGQCMPHRRQWPELAKVLGVPVSEILNEVAA